MKIGKTKTCSSRTERERAEQTGTAELLMRGVSWRRLWQLAFAKRNLHRHKIFKIEPPPRREEWAKRQLANKISRHHRPKSTWQPYTQPATATQCNTAIIITALGGKYLCCRRRRRRRWERRADDDARSKRRKKKSELISHHELKIHYRRRHDFAIFGASERNYRTIKAIWHNLHKGRERESEQQHASLVRALFRRDKSQR